MKTNLTEQQIQDAYDGYTAMANDLYREKANLISMEEELERRTAELYTNDMIVGSNAEKREASLYMQTADIRERIKVQKMAVIWAEAAYVETQNRVKAIDKRLRLLKILHAPAVISEEDED